MLNPNLHSRMHAHSRSKYEVTLRASGECLSYTRVIGEKVMPVVWSTIVLK